MTQYLVVLGARAMDHIPDEEMPTVAKAAHAAREEALTWAAKLAAACFCAQEVWELGSDPELDAMLRQAQGRR
jgi:hypothetical protein